MWRALKLQQARIHLRKEWGSVIYFYHKNIGPYKYEVSNVNGANWMVQERLKERLIEKRDPSKGNYSNGGWLKLRGRSFPFTINSQHSFSVLDDNHLHCYPSSGVNALYHANKFTMLPCKLPAFVHPAVAVTCMDMAMVFKEEGYPEIDRGG
ncbi:hypothetical protein NC652_035183 [Populus alba x Populus x berolinensis]|nr:hypothetical protein NC652_035183 [Populus alba x Populus x berolinensis]